MAETVTDQLATWCNMVPMISPPNAKPSVERTWEPAVQAEQIRLLYQNTALSVGITAAVSSVLCFLQWAVIPHRAVLGWLTYMFLVSSGRFGLWRSFRSRVNLRTARVWGLLFSIGAGLSAAGWGAAGLVLYPKDHLTNQVFLAFVLGGMMVGAASVLAASVVDFALFISLSGLPFALRLLSEGDGPRCHGLARRAVHGGNADHGVARTREHHFLAQTSRSSNEGPTDRICDHRRAQPDGW